MISRRTLISSASALIFAGMVFSSVPAFAEGGNFFADPTSDVAINGYDPVAYFTEGEPIEGNAEYSFSWQGAVWHFSSDENRDLFAAAPEKYAPQYGGYCAYAVSRGYTAPTVPEAWSIVDGKLYLNFSLGVRKTWAKDIAGNIIKADKNWPELSKR